MGSSEEIREFLMSRRAKLSIHDVELPDFGGRRRVPGLRREEVAILAGVSPEYYKRLERGNAKGVSESVLDGVARALQLDEAERTYLDDLVRAANAGTHPSRRRQPARRLQVRPRAQQMIDAMSTVPVFVQNGRLDAIATNQLGRALFAPMFDDPAQPANAARFIFLDARAQEFYADWDGNARQIVALLRAEAGRSPHDRNLSDLVGELSTRSDLFARLWGSHDVRVHQTGLKCVRHPVVGDLDLDFEAMPLASEPGLQMLVFSAEPGSKSAEGLQLLANWSAAADPTSEPRTDTNRVGRDGG